MLVNFLGVGVRIGKTPWKLLRPVDGHMDETGRGFSPVEPSDDYSPK
jgi:hypothetical protein